MGDRAHVIITPEHGEGRIFLYVHWLGSDLPGIVSRAMRRGQDRWDDSPYLGRIIASEVFERAGIHDNTGAGLGTDWMEGPSKNDVYVDMKKATVSTNNHVDLTYSDFLALGLDGD